MKKLILFGIVFVVAIALASPALGAADNRREFDHVGQFNFLMEIEGLTAGRFSGMDGLDPETEVIEYQDGEDKSRDAGDNVGYLLRGVDKKGVIEVQGFEHTITVPTHRQAGAATGETMHGVLGAHSTRERKRTRWRDARLVEVRQYKESALEPGDKPDLEQLQFRYRKIS